MGAMEEGSGKVMRDIVKAHYEQDYKIGLEDSPDETRRDMNRAIMEALREDRVHPPRILNVGSGPQLLERVLLMSYGSGQDPQLLKRTFFATTDLAAIRSQRLKAQKHDNVSHVRGDAETLPFAAESFGMLISNMAIDMMPRTAFGEAARSLVNGGLFVFTFHHPDMMRGIAAETTDPKVHEFVTRGLESGMYFETADDIRTTLAENHLLAEEISARRDSSKYSNSKWWFVRGVKNIDLPSAGNQS